MTQYTELHYELATDKQREYLEAIEKHGSIRKAAKALGISSHATIVKSLSGLRKRAAKRGHSPEHDMTVTVPDGYAVKGTSTLYKDGKAALQWVKTSIDHQRQFEIMQQCIADLCAEVVPAKAKPSTLNYSDECIAVYPLGDPHIGMLSWGEETGQDWDLDIAESAYAAVFDRLIKAAPSCREAAIINLGDFYHYDNMEGVTSRSGHSLDVDSRYARMVRIGMRIMRRMIENALDHHDTVRVINVVGNHDDTSALFMSVALANIYENEPRVIIDDNPTPVHYIHFGKNMVATHHGHTIKMRDLPSIMACDQPEMWGASTFRYGYTGHIHHDSAIELPGCKVESFRTLAAKDAYAAWSRYRSGQDSKCIVLHKDYGEVERHTVNISTVL